AAAAARGGPIAVVTDGEVADVASLAPDLHRAPRVVVLPRTPFRDAFVAAVDGPRRVAWTDTIRLTLSYGAAGRRDPGNGKRGARPAQDVRGARSCVRRRSALGGRHDARARRDGRRAARGRRGPARRGGRRPCGAGPDLRARRRASLPHHRRAAGGLVRGFTG